MAMMKLVTIVCKSILHGRALPGTVTRAWHLLCPEEMRMCMHLDCRLYLYIVQPFIVGRRDASEAIRSKKDQPVLTFDWG